MTVWDVATEGGMYARMVGRTGGEIFSKTAKIPSLQSGVGEEDLARRIAPIAAVCLPPIGIYGLYHAALVREGTRYARHLPYQGHDSKSRQLIEM